MERFHTSFVRHGLLSLALFAAILGPVLALGKDADTIYVDQDNKGEQDGSFDHPYRTIKKAIDKADGPTNIFVAEGEYKENITLKKDMKLIGEGRKETIVKGDDDKPTITMKDDTEVNRITVSGGRHGIRVEEDAEATIVKTVIRNSKRDGIHIDMGTLAKKDQVLVDKTVIKGSAKAGIYSEKRHLIVTNTEITGNADGVDLQREVKAWFADNKINDNRGSGLKITLDHAQFASKDNSIRRNGREGVEINSYGAHGNVSLKKAALIDNGRYGIARVVRFGNQNFKGLHLEMHRMEGNRLGGLSKILFIR